MGWFVVDDKLEVDMVILLKFMWFFWIIVEGVMVFGKKERYLSFKFFFGRVFFFKWFWVLNRNVVIYLRCVFLLIILGKLIDVVCFLLVFLKR